MRNKTIDSAYGIPDEDGFTMATCEFCGQYKPINPDLANYESQEPKYYCADCAHHGKGTTTNPPHDN